MAESRVFTASYRGRCGCCEEPFEAGTSVRYDGQGRLVVDGCPHADEDPYSEAERAAARAAMCGSCFMVHAGECL